MTLQIELSGVYKEYKTYVKDEGIIPSLAGMLHRKYEYVQAVNGVSFSIPPGGILGLIGLNGAGKTTIIKLASGIIKPDAGVVRVLNQDPFKRKIEYRSCVTLVMGQKGQLDIDLSIMDSVALFASIYSLKKKVAFERARDMASELNLTEVDLHKQVRNLSLGQRMKGELILAFIHQPTIIFLDEPTLGLDFPTQNSIRNYLKLYRDEHRASIILTSHYIKDIEDLCDKIYVINAGKELYYGTISELKQLMPDMRKVRFYAGSTTVQRIRDMLPWVVQGSGEQGYVIRFNPSEMTRVMQVLSAQQGISDIDFNDDPLDILIESLYQKDLGQ